MADQDSRKLPSIPAWQQSWQTNVKEETPPPSQPSTPNQDTTSTSPPSDLLDDDSIRDASREEKFEFLRAKGVHPDEIEKLLGAVQAVLPPKSDDPTELKTIHDTTQIPIARETTPPPTTPAEEQEASPQQYRPTVATTTTTTTKRDIPPVITYPEFLLKPQKPPPLVTFERLVNAAYAIAGMSALTWGMSTYIVQPMLESLTEARHSLAETAMSDLETLNTKLESTVSHVPYIPSLAQQQKPKGVDDEQDLQSEDEDPTELFHRDIATQTSPHPSRTHSLSSSTDSPTSEAKNPTTSQSTRLRSLHSTLSSLLASQTTHFSQDRLSTTMSDFQSTLTKLEGSYNPFSLDYTSSATYTGYAGPGASGEYGKGGDKTKKPTDTSEATKFKNEIRGLKGAFLSSRNFPTARPAQPFTLPSR